MTLRSTKRPQPPVFVPAAARGGNGMSTKRNRDLQITLADLGYYKGRITGYYSNDTRNAVSLLQQQLIQNGSYHGRPHGSFDDATRAALIADESIPTTLPCA